MALLCVVTEDGARFLYDERDVMDACKRMRCGHHAKDCRALMAKSAMECVLCHGVLTARKKPYQISAGRTRERTEDDEAGRRKASTKGRIGRRKHYETGGSDEEW